MLKIEEDLFPKLPKKNGIKCQNSKKEKGFERRKYEFLSLLHTNVKWVKKILNIVRSLSSRSFETCWLSSKPKFLFITFHKKSEKLSS